MYHNLIILERGRSCYDFPPYGKWSVSYVVLYLSMSLPVRHMESGSSASPELSSFLSRKWKVANVLVKVSKALSVKS